MMGHGRPGEVLMAATLLLTLLHPALTFPPVKLTPDGGEMEYCGEYDLGAGLPINYVTLEDSLTFLLNASDSLLHLRLMVEDELFKATVSGIYIVMQNCDLAETKCTVIDEGGSKSSDIIATGTWNMITVTHSNNEVKVDVNMQADVVGMPMPKHVGSSAISEVAIVNVDPHSDMAHDPNYSAHVRVLCSDSGAAPSIRQMDPLPMPTAPTPITTSLFPVYPPTPYKDCPVKSVEADHPFRFPMTSDSLTMVVLPSAPSLQLTFTLPQQLYKLSVEGRRMELSKCTPAGEDCVVEDSNNFHQNLLGVGEWNTVTIAVSKLGVRIDLNNVIHIMSQSRISDTSSILVTVLPSLPTGKAQHYSVVVNLQCDDATGGTTSFPGQFTITMPVITTEVTPDYNTTGSPEASTGSDPRTIGIIVGVLLAILLIIAVAFAISTYKKRRSATINQHTPLKEQQQQKQ